MIRDYIGSGALIIQTGEPFVLMYEVLLHPDAQDIYINAEKALAKKIARCLQQLEETPLFHPNIRADRGRLYWILSLSNRRLSSYLLGR